MNDYLSECIDNDVHLRPQALYVYDKVYVHIRYICIDLELQLFIMKMHCFIANLCQRLISECHISIMLCGAKEKSTGIVLEIASAVCRYVS